MALGFSGTISKLKFDQGRFTKDLGVALDRETKLGARAFLKAVVEIVPVFTGMSRGSLKPMGRFLKVNIPINPDSSYMAQWKIAHGQNQAAGEKAQAFSFGRTRLKFQFRFNTQVAHYLVNEFNDVSQWGIMLRHPTPWHSFEAGRQAFRIYAKQVALKKLPRLRKYLVYTRVSQRG